MDRIILHLDMDAFFAAIEQLDFPQYRGKPLIVGADPKEGSGRGVVSTCSYEARSYGIRSAMPISKAYRLCPHAVFVPPRGKRYSQVSKAVMSTLLNFTPDIEQISIDEAFLDISSTYKLYGSPEAIARAVKEAVYKETQLTASVGVAPNKFVAKLASDLKKPDGLVIVEKDNVRQFLAPLELSRLWGIGPKTLPHLEKLGIRTIGELARFSQNELIKRFGKSGLHFWRLANGIDSRDIEKEVAAKSISKEITFDSDEGNEEKLRLTLFYLCDDLSRLMRRKGLKGRTITLKIRLADFSTFTRSRTLTSSTSDSREIRSLAEGLYSQFDRQGHKVRLLGIGLSHLDGEEVQLDLFEQEPSKTRKIDSLLDEVKEKFGEQAITRASLLDKPRDSMWIRD